MQLRRCTSLWSRKTGGKGRLGVGCHFLRCCAAVSAALVRTESGFVRRTCTGRAFMSYMHSCQGRRTAQGPVDSRPRPIWLGYIVRQPCCRTALPIAHNLQRQHLAHAVVCPMPRNVVPYRVGVQATRRRCGSGGSGTRRKGLRRRRRRRQGRGRCAGRAVLLAQRPLQPGGGSCSGHHALGYAP